MRRLLTTTCILTALACTSEARAQFYYNNVPLGNTIQLTDSVLSPTTPIVLTRTGSRWESQPINGVAYRLDPAEGFSLVVDGRRVFGGWILGSGDGKVPIVIFGMVPYGNPFLRAYGVDVAKVPPDPVPYVFWELR